MTPSGVSAASMSGNRSSAFSEERLVAEELQVVVAAQLRVAAEIHVAGELAPALEAARAERQHAVGARAAGSSARRTSTVCRDSRLPAARRVFVAERTRVARASGPYSRNTVVSCTYDEPERHELAAREQHAPVLLLLVLVGDLLQARLVVFLLELEEAAGHLEARVAVERVDAERVAPRAVCVAMRLVAIDVAVIRSP